MNHNVESKNFKAFATLQDALAPFYALQNVNNQRPIGHYQNNAQSKAFLELGLPDLARVTGHANASKLKDALDVLDAITTDFTTAFHKAQNESVNAYRAFFASYFADLNEDLDLTSDDPIQIVLYYPALVGLNGINASLTSTNGTHYDRTTGEIRTQLMFTTEDADFHADVVIRATGRWTIVGLREMHEQFQSNYIHHGEMQRIAKTDPASPVGYVPMTGYTPPETISWRDRMAAAAEYAKANPEGAEIPTGFLGAGRGGFRRGQMGAAYGSTGSAIGDAAMLQSGQAPGAFMGGRINTVDEANAAGIAELHRRAAVHHLPDNLSKDQGSAPLGNDE